MSRAISTGVPKHPSHRMILGDASRPTYDEVGL